MYSLDSVVLWHFDWAFFSAGVCFFLVFVASQLVTWVVDRQRDLDLNLYLVSLPLLQIHCDSKGKSSQGRQGKEHGA